VIAMCHHSTLSPRTMIPSPTTPTAALPAKAPAMRRTVARVSKATTTKMIRYGALNKWSCSVVNSSLRAFYKEFTGKPAYSEPGRMETPLCA